MAQIKVSEAADLVLDWMVAKCKGDVAIHMFENSKGFRVYANESMKRQGIPFTPSTDWSQGGHLIEREKITINAWRNPDEWTADVLRGMTPIKAYTGSTALIAAMRCYVASKLGDVVEVPDELVK